MTRHPIYHVIIVSAWILIYAVLIQTKTLKPDTLIDNEVFNLSQDRWKLEEWDNIEEKDTGNYIIPNIAHYIWYSNVKKPLKFVPYLSIMSAARLMKADKIYFHTNNEPVGKYWEEVKKLPNFIVTKRKPPTELFGVKLKQAVYVTSNSNADRVKVLQEYGGVISDLDVLYVRSLAPLRKYPAVVGECLY